MRISQVVRLCILVCLLALSSCGGFEKVKKSSDVNYKLTKANEYYDKKDYQRANDLYKDLLGVMRNTRNAENIYYRYAYTFYNSKDYLEASYYFKNFTEMFPKSTDADECEFMSAVSLYKYSPKFSLDQTNTIKAFDAFQTYINTHPKSTRLAEANTYIDNCRNKLETKDADAAKLYYNISQFKASGIAYKSLMRNYPESGQSDFYQYMIVRSSYKYAKASVPEKQEERYANSIGAYNEMKDNYPHSPYLDEAKKYYAEADKQVKKIRDEQHK